jgi:hypothetical protein
MKKIFSLVMITCMFTINAMAQKTTIGFNAGSTLSTYKVKVDNTSSTSDSKFGFSAGMVVDVPISKIVSFQPALEFTQKGGKENLQGYKFTTNLNYIEMPLNILFKTNSSKTRFYIGAGPSLAIGLSGKMKFEGDGQSEDADIKFGTGDNDDLKGLDIGANILAGCQFKGGALLSLTYNLGMSNLIIDGDKNNSYKNNYFGLRIGYMLPNVKKHK